MRATSGALGLALALVLAACGKPERTPAASCGIASLAGPTVLLGEFGVPRQTLSVPPERLPEQLAVRLVAGPAYRGIVGRSDSLVIIGAEGSLPGGVRPGFGVLVVDPAGTARGAMLYEGAPIENAPHIGTVTFGSASVPLLGVQVDPARIEDPRCPFFPDSVIR